MIKYLRKIISLRNLESDPKGQIATLLIFMMVVVLIFILVTVNVGRVSLTATNLANAADSGSLYLASQLATKSHMLEQALGGTKKCQKGGLLGVITSVLFAIVAIVAAPFTAGASIVAVGALGGAFGGALGAMIMGTSIGQGALSGLAIGAAIGTGAYLGTTITTPGASVSSGTTATVSTEGGLSSVTGTLETAGTIGSKATVTIGAESMMGPVNVTGTLVSATASHPLLGAALNVGLAAGSNIWSSSVADKTQSSVMQSAAKALNGLPEYDRYREGVFLQVLSQVIDDPNTIQDSYDVNSNGDVEEKVPYFSYWWFMRTEEMREIVPVLKDLTSAFVDGPLTTFRNYADNPYTDACLDYSDTEGYEEPKQICNPKCLNRIEVEGEDGVVVELLRKIEESGRNISFWQPGSEDNDELDYTISELKDFVVVADAIRAQDREQLPFTWQSWIKPLYDKESEGDYYDILGNMAYGNADKEMQGLNAWRSEIITIRNSLPNCKYETTEDAGTYISNPPCKDYSEGQTFATIDDDLIDEFVPVLTAIDELKAKIETFRPSIEQYYNDMTNKYATMTTIGTSGLNPVSYVWKTKDSAGNQIEHKAIAEVSNFKIPSIRFEQSGNWLKKKKCQKLIDYSDNGSNTWVRVTRKEPANKASGIAGKWNPYDNDDPLDQNDSNSDGWFSVSKLSRARYSYDNVGLAGTK